MTASGREGSEAAGGDASTPAPLSTPGLQPSGLGSNIDAMDIDGPSIDGGGHGVPLGQAMTAAEQVYEDDEFKMWKQITKRDRALVTRERFALFDGNRLNPDAPALLRTKAGMRRYLKAQKELAGGALPDAVREANKPAETLAEGMEGDVETALLPDYYEPLSLLPDIASRLQWVEDGEGQVINQHEEYLSVVPKGHFTAPPSRFNDRYEANLRQIQETRKLATRISVVKQMQVQTQVSVMGVGFLPPCPASAAYDAHADFSSFPPRSTKTSFPKQ
jgi:transcriptional activator SPT7